MGDKQSRPATGADPADDGKGAVNKGSEAPDGAAGTACPPSCVVEADGTGAGAHGVETSSAGSRAPASAGAGAAVGEEGSAREAEAVPSESEILSRLVISLGQRPGRCMPLSKIREQLPPSLRRMAEDVDCVSKWAQRFPGLLEVSGPPGEEQIALLLGRPPRSNESDSPVPGAAANGAAAGLASSPDKGGGPPPAAAAPAPPPPPALPDAAVTEPTGTAALEAMSRGGGGVGARGEDDPMNPATVQLRGLPFRATVAEIRAFLGDHAAYLDHAGYLAAGEPAIRLLLNRDGRPSGFARVQFTSPEAAMACRASLHRQQMGDRYVEVLLCSERAGGKARHRRIGTTGEGGAPAEVSGTGAGEGTAVCGADGTGADAVERERVLRECREHMVMPGRQQLLLSMLGIALSPPARNYLRRSTIGLKHFLARYPNEFRVEGPKGCERVVWCPAGVLAPLPSASGESFEAALAAQEWSNAVAAAAAAAGEAMPQPGTPRLMQSPTPHEALPGSAHCLETPSDWGTPMPLQSSGGTSATSASDLGAGGRASTAATASAAAAAAAAVMDAGGFPGSAAAAAGWPPFGWAAPWAGAAGGPWGGGWPQDPLAGLSPAEAAAAAARGGDHVGGGGGRPSASAGKRGGARSSGDAPSARSHAHLHPQSHPFANRPASTAGSADGSASAGSATGGAGTPEGEQKSNVAALRLRGLPFNMTVQDVYAFFAQYDVADRIADIPQASQLLTKANGRPSGQAVVQMRSRFDAEVAQQSLHHQWIGGRYIEVFVYGDEPADATGVLDFAQMGCFPGDAMGGAAPAGAGGAAAATAGTAGPLAALDLAAAAVAIAGGATGTAPAATPPWGTDLGGSLGAGSPPWAMPPWASILPPLGGGAAGAGAASGGSAAAAPGGSTGGESDAKALSDDQWTGLFSFLYQPQAAEGSGATAAAPPAPSASATPATAAAPRQRVSLQV